MLKNLLFTLVLIVMMNGCNESKEQTQTETRTSKEVYTVNYPIYYFTQRMAPKNVRVIFPVPNDVDPAFWQPDTEEILGFAQADLIILNGADYAKWRSTASLPESKLVNTSKAFEKDFIHIKSADHSHGPGGEHSHAGTAFTTWLDMQQAIKQAEAIKNALVHLDPAHKDQIEQSYRKLKHELEELDSAFKNAVKDLQRPIVSSHPVYQYFARAYGLNLKSLLWEAEMKIDAKAKGELSVLLETHPAKVMVWEGKPTEENAAYIESMAIKNIIIDPCMNRPSQGDFMTVIHANVKMLEKAY